MFGPLFRIMAAGLRTRRSQVGGSSGSKGILETTGVLLIPGCFEIVSRAEPQTKSCGSGLLMIHLKKEKG
jgi:hypothetical protein